MPGVADDSSASSARIDLVVPDAQLGDSYRALVAEFEAAGGKLVPFVLAFDASDLCAMLARLDDCARGIGLPDGFVPHSTFWLVEDGTHVVGVSNIRHALTPSLLREGGHIGYGIRPSARGRGLGNEILRRSLRRAHELGIRDVLVTCAADNVASARVIRHSGGVLESQAFVPERDEIVQRYWIREGGA
jgi:predicted acetyltransferase